MGLPTVQTDSDRNSVSITFSCCLTDKTVRSMENILKHELGDTLFLISWPTSNRVRLTTKRSLGQEAYIGLVMFVNGWMNRLQELR